jgi:hypothetical protein
MPVLTRYPLRHHPCQRLLERPQTPQNLLPHLVLHVAKEFSESAPNRRGAHPAKPGLSGTLGGTMRAVQVLPYRPPSEVRSVSEIPMAAAWEDHEARSPIGRTVVDIAAT